MVRMELEDLDLSTVPYCGCGRDIVGMLRVLIRRWTGRTAARRGHLSWACGAAVRPARGHWTTYDAPPSSPGGASAQPILTSSSRHSESVRLISPTVRSVRTTAVPSERCTTLTDMGPVVMSLIKLSCSSRAAFASRAEDT